MKYGVFSDAHANYEALDAVFKCFDKEGVGGYIFCGDLIGYGPRPDACASLVRRLHNLTAVAGNHDKALSDPFILNHFSVDSIAPIMLANGELTKENFNFISALPPAVHREDFSLVHGTFYNPYKEYWITKNHYKYNFNLWRGTVCFVGHTHIPFYMCSKDNRNISIGLFDDEYDEISFEPGARYVINPGSVGQPRDRDNRACAGIFDSSAGTFKIIRAPYNIEETQYLMALNMFSPRLIGRLKTGI